MAGFGLPNFGQLTEAFRKAQEIQQNAQKLCKKNSMRWKSRAAATVASIWLSGNQQPLRVQIDPALLSEGQDRHGSRNPGGAAIRLRALHRHHERAHEDLTGGLNLNLPGMGG